MERGDAKNSTPKYTISIQQKPKGLPQREREKGKKHHLTLL